MQNPTLIIENKMYRSPGNKDHEARKVNPTNCGYVCLTSDYQMYVHDPWFAHLKSGKKTIEGRMGGKWSKLKNGDRIHIINYRHCIVVRVIDVRKYNSLEEYLRLEGLEKTLPSVKTIEEGVKIYTMWYAKEEVKRKGMLAIELELAK